VVARIGQIQRGLGGVQLLLQGELRATSLQYPTTEGYLSAVVTHVEEQTPLDEKDPAFAALYKEIRERAGELGERRGLPEEVVHQVLDSVDDAGKFADLVAGYIELTVAEKQGLLETLSVEERLRRVLVHVQRQIGLLEAQEDIKSQVQEELGERQREMFLREKIKAIQKELGDGEGLGEGVGEGEGDGLALANTFTHENRIRQAASGVGAAQYCIDQSVAYARERTTFGQPLSTRQAIQWPLVELQTECEMVRQLVRKTAWELDQVHHMEISDKVAMCNYRANRLVCDAADQAMQVHGGIGYTRHLPFEHIYRHHRRYRITEGSEEIQIRRIAQVMFGFGRPRE